MVDAEEATERVRAFYREQLEATRAGGYVVGVSGGLDSAVAVTLAAQAVGSDAVTGMVMPGEPSDPEHMADARELVDELGIEGRDVDIAPLVDGFQAATPYEAGRVAMGNVRARVRMVLAYLETNVSGGLVVGPDNRSEYLLGYFTKYGDGAADVRPLADLYKTEVYDLARAIDLRAVRREDAHGGAVGGTDRRGRTGSLLRDRRPDSPVVRRPGPLNRGDGRPRGRRPGDRRAVRAAGRGDATQARTRTVPRNAAGGVTHRQFRARLLRPKRRTPRDE